jgi:hypothetical protein
MYPFATNQMRSMRIIYCQHSHLFIIYLIFLFHVISFFFLLFFWIHDFHFESKKKNVNKIYECTLS